MMTTLRQWWAREWAQTDVGELFVGLGTVATTVWVGVGLTLEWPVWLGALPVLAILAFIPAMAMLIAACAVAERVAPTVQGVCWAVARRVSGLRPVGVSGAALSSAAPPEVSPERGLSRGEP